MDKVILPDSNPDLIGKNYIHQVLRNAGVKRIKGSELFDNLANDKLMYFIEEIGTLAIKATLGEDGEDIMLGTTGQPVAGSNTARATIQYPYNGQLFFNTDTDEVFVYVDGNWQLGSGAPQGYAPQAIVIEADRTLTPGLEYLAVGDLTLDLPTQDLIDGHVITVTTTGNCLLQGGDIFYLDTVYTSANLDPSQRYNLIYFDGIWYSDITLMRRLYVTDTEPTNAPEGSIWIDTSEV